MLVLVVGILAVFGVFASSKDATLVSQRQEVAVHQAQREMEQLRALLYGELGLKLAPGQSTDPKNPNYRVQSGNRFRVKSNPAPCGGSGQPPCNLDEDLVLPADAPAGVIDPGPEAFTVNENGAAVTGKVYRYITWRDENCPATVCDGTKNTKRLIVAVTIDPIVGRPNLGPANPVWLTSIAEDPNEGPDGGSQQTPAPGPTSSAQSFFLYDKRCSNDDANNSYTAPDAADSDGDGRKDYDHNVYDTAGPATSCENAQANQRPNLMGPALPTYSYTAPLPPYRYSKDLGGDYPAGLAMLKGGPSCPVSSYNTGDSQGLFKVHAWATRKFTLDFTLNGSAFLSLWTTSVGSLPGAGRFCATLIDRDVVAGVPSDVVLGSATREYSPWPTTKSEPGRSCGTPDFPCGRQLTFQFSLTGTHVRAGGRLMLFVSVLGSSDKDLVFLYDDPRYRSLLQVDTTTPCDATGVPCPTT